MDSLSLIKNLTERDLEQLCNLVEEKDGGPAWVQMMDRSTPTMTYQAWRRDPEVGLCFVYFVLQWVCSNYCLRSW